MSLGEARPVFGGPIERQNCQGWGTVSSAIIEVTAEPFLAVVGENAGMAGTDEIITGLQKQSAAPVQHIFAVLVKIGTGNAVAAPDADVIRAVDTAAAKAPVHKQIIVPVVWIYAGGFD